MGGKVPRSLREGTMSRHGWWMSFAKEVTRRLLYVFHDVEARPRIRSNPHEGCIEKSEHTLLHAPNRSMSDNGIQRLGNVISANVILAINWANTNHWKVTLTSECLIVVTIVTDLRNFGQFGIMESENLLDGNFQTQPPWTVCYV